MLRPPAVLNVLISGHGTSRTAEPKEADMMPLTGRIR
jgi:hypothetical protein